GRRDLGLTWYNTGRRGRVPPRSGVFRDDRGLRGREPRRGGLGPARPPERGQAPELRMRARAYRVGLDPVPGWVLPGGARFHRLRRPGGVPLPVGPGPPVARLGRLRPDGPVPLYPRPRLAVRLPRRDPGVEIKPPIPVIPPPA